jgi:ribosomal protein L34E
MNGYVLHAGNSIMARMCYIYLKKHDYKNCAKCQKFMHAIAQALKKHDYKNCAECQKFMHAIAQACVDVHYHLVEMTKNYYPGDEGKI